MVTQVEFFRGFFADNVFYLLQALQARMTDKGVKHVFEGEFQATDFIQYLGEHFIGDAFAIDQYAIAVKNDQVERLAQLDRARGIFFGDSRGK